MNQDPKLAEELKKMEQEPLLPVEVTLVKWSLGLGLALLILLVLVNQFLFRN
ncbi:MAG: hypothetical protein OEV92_12685 [Nitrospinota bacterium]|nr:hypothetical protein [Nitrospinota bacterium]